MKSWPSGSETWVWLSCWKAVCCTICQNLNSIFLRLSKPIWSNTAPDCVDKHASLYWMTQMQASDLCSQQRSYFFKFRSPSQVSQKDNFRHWTCTWLCTRPFSGAETADTYQSDLSVYCNLNYLLTLVEKVAAIMLSYFPSICSNHSRCASEPLCLHH